MNDADPRVAAPFYTPRPLRRRGQPSKARLEAMLRLAKFYRGWTAKDLAGELDRHVHNLVPGSGVPKIDLVVGISDLLDWPVEVVIADLYEGVPQPAAPPSGKPHRDLTTRLAALWRFLDSDQLLEAVEMGESLLRENLDAVSFAYASSVLSDAYEGLGRYLQAIEVLRRGLARANRDNPHRDRLRAHLAYCHYVIGNVCEAESLATATISENRGLQEGDPGEITVASAHFIRGSCSRLLCTLESSCSARDAAFAAEDLAVAAEIYRRRARTGDEARLLALAATSEFALLEVRSILGQIDPRAAVDSILQALDGVNPDELATKHDAESLAWGCIYGCTIVLRHLRSDPDADRLLAIFTNMADLLATRLGHWALRERCWTIEHVWRVESESTEYALDLEDIQTLTGTMGRFPAFRERGWEILERWRQLGEES